MPSRKHSQDHFSTRSAARKRKADRYANAGDDPINNLDPTGRYLSQCQSQAINLAIGATGLGFGYGVALLALAGGATTAAGVGAIAA